MIRVENISLEYDKGNPILENVSFKVEAGQFVSLIGQSGSGKTSILRAIAGLQQPSKGKVTVEDLSSRVGFLFQDDALLPWRTVRQNVSLGLRIQGEKTEVANKKADDWLEKLSLFELGDRYPSQLSGGQRKRVAIAQVLALHPKVILMDEPFASLDAIVRTRITQELIEWVEQEHITVLLITHDLEEAISLSDVVHVLSPGPKAYIKSSHPVTIPRPRDILETRNDTSFAPLLKTLLNELVGERKKVNVVKSMNSAKVTSIRKFLVFTSLIIFWEFASRIGWINPFYMPSPWQVVKVIIELFQDGEIWKHLSATFFAAVVGIIGGLAIGIVLGFASALTPVIAELLEPIMIMLNAIPRVILAPLFVIWFGIGIESKIALSLILVVVLVFFAVYNGIRDVDHRLVERVQTLGGGKWILLREVYIPSVTAWIIGNLKVAVGFAFTGAVVGEFVGSSKGLGYLLQFAQSTYNAALTISLIILIMAFVMVLFSGAERIENHLLRWRPKKRTS